MRRSLPALALLLALLAPAPVLAASPLPSPSPSSPPPASASPSPSPLPSPPPSPSPSPPAPSTPSPGPTGASPASPPAQPAPSLTTVPPQAIDRARLQLGDAVASALADQRGLAQALDQSADAQAQIQGRMLEAQRQLQAAERSRQELEARMADTRQRVEVERAELELLAKVLYEQPDSVLLQLLEAGSASDLVTEAGDLAELGLRAHALEAQLQDDLHRLQEEEAQRDAEETRARQLQAQLGAWSTQLQQLRGRMQATLDQLQGSIQRGQAALAGAGPSALVEQLLADEDRLLGQLSAVAEQEVWEEEQLWAQLNPPSATPLPAPSPGPAGGATFIWPVQGFTLTQRFGPTTLALEPAMFGYPHFHTGVDLAVPVGTPVAAAAAGEVVQVGSGTTGYGTYVMIAHGGGLVTLYGHLSQALVGVGQWVAQGQAIGLSGSTGDSTGPHLHFEVRLNGEPVDPLGYLAAG